MEEEDDVVVNGDDYPGDLDKQRKVDEEQLLSIGSEDLYGVAFMMQDV